MSKIVRLEDLSSIRDFYHFRNKKIVFTVGTFDLIHSGHAEFLAMAKTFGDVLVVGVSNNSSVRRQKGEYSPLLDEGLRAETISYLKSVDYVVVVDEIYLSPVLYALRPDVFYSLKKYWTKSRLPIFNKLRTQKELDYIRSYGGKVVKVQQREPYVSSSALVEKVAFLKICPVIGKHVKDFEGEPASSRGEPAPHRYGAGGGPLELLVSSFRGRIVEEDKLSNLSRSLKDADKKIVFTAGSWDLLHVGHERYLCNAKKYGDVLVVGVSSNSWIKRFKGKGRPIVDEKSRAELLCFLGGVDYVVIFRERTVKAVLESLKPDVFYTVEEDWNDGYDKSPEYSVVKRYSGSIVRVGRQAPFVSASSIIDRAADNKILELFGEGLAKSVKGQVIEDKNYNEYTKDLQKNARITGEYEKVLSVLNKCPFCDLKDKYFVKELSNTVLTTSLFPYIDGHLLIIPKRHIETLSEVTLREWKEIKELFSCARKVLEEKLKIKDVNLLYREGENSGKSVGHLHFHVVPFSNKGISKNWGEINYAPEDVSKLLRS